MDNPTPLRLKNHHHHCHHHHYHYLNMLIIFVDITPLPNSFCHPIKQLVDFLSFFNLLFKEVNAQNCATDFCFCHVGCQ